MATDWFSRVGGLMLAGVLMASLASAEATRDPAPRQLYAEPSPLARVITGMDGAPEAARLDLAVLIVEALVSAYESEMDQALLELTRDAGDRRRLRRWQQSVGPVLSELRVARAALYAAREVDLYADRHGQIRVLVDGRPFWVAWPRVTVQNRLERELVAEFCARHACPSGDTDGATRPAEVHGGWVLSQGRPPGWETADGVRCEFPDLSSRSEREAECRALATDLHVLAAALREAVRRGESIEWRHLALDTTPAAGRERILVTERGDYLSVAVPTLADHPLDWAEVRRWLRARIEGGSVTATVLRASGTR